MFGRSRLPKMDIPAEDPQSRILAEWNRISEPLVQSGLANRDDQGLTYDEWLYKRGPPLGFDPSTQPDRFALIERGANQPKGMYPPTYREISSDKEYDHRGNDITYPAAKRDWYKKWDDVANRYQDKYKSETGSEWVSHRGHESRDVFDEANQDFWKQFDTEDEPSAQPEPKPFSKAMRARRGY